MIKIKEFAELPFIEATVTFRGKRLKLEKIGIKPEANDVTQTIQSVGGLEFVYTKNIDQIAITNDIKVDNFSIELGSMDYFVKVLQTIRGRDRTFEIQ